MKTRINEKGVEQVWYSGAWRSKESLERKREQQCAHKKALYHSSEIERERIKKNRNKSRLNNLEKDRQRKRDEYERNKGTYLERRKQWAKDNREQQRLTYRQWYARDREGHASEERSRRDERNPARVVRRTVNQIKEGVIGLNEAVKLIRESHVKHTRKLRDRQGDTTS